VFADSGAKCPEAAPARSQRVRYGTGCARWRCMYEQHAQPSPEVRVEIEAYVASYRSELLSAGQAATMLPRMRALVLAAEPASALDARWMLGSLGRLLADVAPVEGGDVDEFLTDVEIARWANRQHVTTRTLSNNVGRLKRLLRVKAGLPARIRVLNRATLLPEPLDDDRLDRVIDACRAAGEAACRGFAAAIGAGWMDRTVCGATFTCDSAGMWWMGVDDTRWAAHPIVGRVSSLMGDRVVRDGDWLELRQAAVSDRVFIDANVARQTFRRLVFSLDEPVATVMHRYRITSESVEALVPYLPRLAVTDPTSITALRGAPPATSI